MGFHVNGNSTADMVSYQDDYDIQQAIYELAQMAESKGNADAKHKINYEVMWRASFCQIASRLASLLTGKECKVEISSGFDTGDTAWYAGNGQIFFGDRWYRNNVKKILLGMEPGSLSDAVARMYGLLYHEIAHALWTPVPKHKGAGSNIWKAGMRELSPRAKLCLNVLEDQRIERLFIGKYRPAERYINRVIATDIASGMGQDEAKRCESPTGRLDETQALWAWSLLCSRKHVPADIRKKAGIACLEACKRLGVSDEDAAEHLRAVKSVADEYVKQNSATADGKRHMLRLAKELDSRMDKIHKEAADNSFDEGTGEADQEKVEQARDLSENTGASPNHHSGTDQPNSRAEGTEEVQNTQQQRQDQKKAQATEDKRDDADRDVVEEAIEDTQPEPQDESDDSNDAGGESGSDDSGADSASGWLDDYHDDFAEWDAETADDVAEYAQGVAKNIDEEIDNVGGSAHSLWGRRNNSVRKLPADSGMKNLRDDVQQQFSVVMSEMEESWECGLSSGAFDVAAAMQSRGLHTDVFRELHGTDMEPGGEVVLLLDRSSSMSDTCAGGHSLAHSANRAAWILASGGQNHGFDVTVIGFASTCQVLSTPDDVIDQDSYDHHYPAGGTSPDAALLEANRIFRQSDKTSKILITITDGDWAGEKSQQDDLLSNMRSNGVESLIVGLVPYYSPGNFIKQGDDGLWRGHENCVELSGDIEENLREALVGAVLNVAERSIEGSASV